jgi:hypothetical protein
MTATTTTTTTTIMTTVATVTVATAAPAVGFGRQVCDDGVALLHGPVERRAADAVFDSGFDATGEQQLRNVHVPGGSFIAERRTVKLSGSLADAAYLMRCCRSLPMHGGATPVAAVAVMGAVVPTAKLISGPKVWPSLTLRTTC